MGNSSRSDQTDDIDANGFNRAYKVVGMASAICLIFTSICVGILFLVSAKINHFKDSDISPIRKQVEAAEKKLAYHICIADKTVDRMDEQLKETVSKESLDDQLSPIKSGISQIRTSQDRLEGKMEGTVTRLETKIDDINKLLLRLVSQRRSDRIGSAGIDNGVGR